MKKTGLVYLLLLVSLISCNNFPPPKTELCIVTEERDMACSLEDESYYRELSTGDIATNPDDYRILVQYVNDLRQSLIKCRRKK